MDKIVNLPMDEFATYAISHNFGEEQMNTLRDAMPLSRHTTNPP